MPNCNTDFSLQTNTNREVTVSAATTPQNATPPITTTGHAVTRQQSTSFLSMTWHPASTTFEIFAFPCTISATKAKMYVHVIDSLSGSGLDKILSISSHSALVDRAEIRSIRTIVILGQQSGRCMHSLTTKYDLDRSRPVCICSSLALHT